MKTITAILLLAVLRVGSFSQVAFNQNPYIEISQRDMTVHEREEIQQRSFDMKASQLDQSADISYAYVASSADNHSLAQMTLPEGGDTSDVQRQLVPELSFFEDCAFVCIDIQPMTTQPVGDIPREWEEAGYTREDCQAANDFFFEQTVPNARKVADSCRALGMPMIFVHWGCLFTDGMDLDPAVRRTWMKNGEIDRSQVPYIGHSVARPNPALGIREEDYVLPKTAQDAFSSSNLGYILENLAVRNIVFVGGHTNPGGCLGKTARSACERGYTILCIEDATFDAGESTRKPGIASVPFDYVMTTRDFLRLAGKIQGNRDEKPGATAPE